MQTSLYDSVRRKVEAIFLELAGERAHRLSDITSALPARDAIAAACSSSFPARIADELAFHMLDWNYDAAFIAALHLFPERFTPEEITAGIGMFLSHVPAHVMAAGRLYGCPVEDILADTAQD